jgi:hypothetical protein
MQPVLYDAAGHRRSPVTMPGFHEGRAPRNKGRRYPADPPAVEEIIAVMPEAGSSAARAGSCLARVHPWLSGPSTWRRCRQGLGRWEQPVTRKSVSGAKGPAPKRQQLRRPIKKSRG